VAIMPAAPKERYTDPENGAHFEFPDMCRRLDKIAKHRMFELGATNSKQLNKDFKSSSKAMIVSESLNLQDSQSQERLSKNAGGDKILEIRATDIQRAMLDSKEGRRKHDVNSTEEGEEEGQSKSFQQRQVKIRTVNRPNPQPYHHNNNEIASAKITDQQGQAPGSQQ